MKGQINVVIVDMYYKSTVDYYRNKHRLLKVHDDLYHLLLTRRFYRLIVPYTLLTNHIHHPSQARLIREIKWITH